MGITCVSLASILFVFIQISREHWIHFWDDGFYWVQAVDATDALYKNPYEALSNIYESVNVDEYNSLSAFFTSIPLSWFSNSYVAYVTINYSMFLLPSLLITSLSIRHLVQQVSNWKPPVTPILLLTTTSAVALFPVILGYIDAVALLPISTLLYLCLRHSFSKFDFVTNVSVGVLLVWPIILRRHFTFFTAAFVIAVLIQQIFLALRPTKGERKNRLIGLLKSSLIIIGTSGLIFCSAFNKLLLIIFNNDYDVAYDAYGDDYISNVIGSCQKLGVVAIILSILGFVFLFKSKETRPSSIFLFVQMVISILMFSYLQTMGWQHLYNSLLPCLILAGVSVFVLYYHLKSYLEKRNVHTLKSPKLSFVLTKSLAVAIVSVLWLPMYLHGLFGVMNNTFGQVLFGNGVYTPRIRNDISSINSLVDEINLLASDGKRTYVISSSLVLNDSILTGFRFPAERNAVPSMTAVSQVDLVQGFPKEFLVCDIIVVADPIQTHLDPKGQRVVSLLAEMFLKPSIVGDKFALHSSYELDNNVFARVYLRTEPYDSADIEYIKSKFNLYYAQYPALFSDRIKLPE
jgi:hypothetical protein